MAITCEVFFRIHSKSPLLITTNLFTKLWGSSSKSFWDILLTREKCPKLQKAITHEVFFKIYSKVNQVFYSSLPIYASSFKALASIVFFRYFADKISSIFFQRAIPQERGNNPVKKQIRVSCFFMRNPFKKFEDSSMYISKVMLSNKKRDEWTDEWPRSNMPLQLLRSWGHNKPPSVTYCKHSRPTQPLTNP